MSNQVLVYVHVYVNKKEAEPVVKQKLLLLNPD